MRWTLLLSTILLVGCGDVTSEPGLSGDAARGGQLYDTWWSVTGQAAPEGDHPLWASRPDPEANASSGATTWRCKECHGWDYRGVDGAYGSGSHRTGFPGIRDSQKSAEQLAASLREAHGYGAAGLSAQDVADLVAFVREETIDTATLLDAEGHFSGSADAGATLYAQGVGTNKRCAACHGADGLEAPRGNADYEDFVGRVATENPWELQHKIRFGQPGTKMPRGVDAAITSAQLKDLGAFCQSLPTEP